MTSTPEEEDFSNRMVDILNYGALNVAIGLGAKTGLFEALDGTSVDEPLTASELAFRAGGLSDRVVREWLGVVVSGNIVDVVVVAVGHDHVQGDGDGNHCEDERFYLPPHRAKHLCARGGSDNLSTYCQEIPILTSCVYNDVLSSFHTGAGIPYSKYPPFLEFMAQLANEKHSESLVQRFLPTIDGLVSKLQRGGMKVMDVGCGQGVAITLMARAFPNSTFCGIDLDGDAIAKARAAADLPPNVSFSVLDATQMDEQQQQHDGADAGCASLFGAGTFDCVIALDAIHDLCHPELVLRGIHRALKPGGIFSMIDIKADSCIHQNRHHPMGPMLYAVSLMHCMQVAMVDNGRGLGMMWGRQQAKLMLQDAGFVNVREFDIPDDGFNLHFMAEKQE